MTTELVLEALSGLVGGEVRAGQVRCAGRQLRWIEAGSGEPVVLLGAGAGEPGSLAWAAVIPALAASTRVVAYDRQGLGASDPSDELSLESAITDLVTVAAAVSARPPILVGHSWGGLLALLTAAKNPAAACALVLVDPADERYWRSLPEDAFAADEQLAAALIEKSAQGELGEAIRTLARPFALQLAEDPVLQSLVVEAHVSCYATATQAAMLLAESRMARESIPLISAIRSSHGVPAIPIAVLSATEGVPVEQRTVWTAAHADLVAQAQDGTHVVVPGVGHAIHQERPGDVVAVIRDVVERCRMADRASRG